MRTVDLEYDLPEAAIATAPATPRDSARLLFAPLSGGPAEHRRVRDLPGLLRAGDLLVFNSTRVLRARFAGVRSDTGGKMEGLFLHEEPEGWVCLIRAKRIRPGMVLAVQDGRGATLLTLTAVEPRAAEPGSWLVAPRMPDGSAADGPAAGVLERVGLTPLPPYILKARRHAGLVDDDGEDHERYQTVFARGDRSGSVAAPTAGLHFTPELLGRLEAAGVGRAEVVLHVGTGTFRTVETEHVEEHPMHTEWCSMSREALAAVLTARREGRRVIAVGTTSARTLEAYAGAMESGGPGWEPPGSLSTRILITPGYRWRWVDGMVTNFHLPRSTLMAMVAARLSPAPGEGVARLKALYAEALGAGYRFYSFGDAMLLA